MKQILKYATVGLLIHSLVAGQEKVSEQVIKFLRNPRLGEAQLTRRDGQTQKGRILRVTDQFIAFETSQSPRVCENVDWSQIVAVQPSPSPGQSGAGSYSVGLLLYGVLFAPFLIADVIAHPFYRPSPPLKPLGGSWRGSEGRGLSKSSLEFSAGTVHYRTTTRKRGRWVVEHDRLHLTFDGEPEWISRFHFECGELVLGDPREVFNDWNNLRPATAPIVGDWHRRDVRLNLQPGGGAVEEESGVRDGTFENTSTSVKIHWTDSTGPGGEEWIAQIKHRHIVVNVNGVTTKYHYEPPPIFDFE
jgi:hypothetical protein